MRFTIGLIALLASMGMASPMPAAEVQAASADNYGQCIRLCATTCLVGRLSRIQCVLCRSACQRLKGSDDDAEEVEPGPDGQPGGNPDPEEGEPEVNEGEQDPDEGGQDIVEGDLPVVDDLPPVEDVLPIEDLPLDEADLGVEEDLGSEGDA